MDLARLIKLWGRELGFQQLAITDTDLKPYRSRVEAWLKQGYQGSMGYLERNLEKRLQPDRLIPGTQRIISARMDYLPLDTSPVKILKQGDIAYISRYALGRDYHKVLRRRLARLADRINQYLDAQPESKHGSGGVLHANPPSGGARRAFVDSAPVLEKPLAEKAGLGWIGKNTLLLNREAGSWFFLGEVFLDLPVPVDTPHPVPEKSSAEHPCGACRACINACPTGAILTTGELDASRCISYLTIENPGAIPKDLRKPMGNRIFGCDDCQLICPWNRYAKPSLEEDFQPRHGLDRPTLLALFQLTEDAFLRLTEGSALRRIKYWQWLRNLSVALGNAPADPPILHALKARREQLRNPDDAQPMHQVELVIEHIDWAIEQQSSRCEHDRADTLDF